MTSDQLTPRQRATGGLILDGRGWGFGVSILNPPQAAGSPVVEPDFWGSTYRMLQG
jgi:hypothetical protein